MERRTLHIVDSFEEAERLDRAFWHSASLSYRMRSLELLRQMNLG